jgi:hypothetical protein
MVAEREAELFARGIEQFNRREFFEAHESWEAVWLAALEPDKTFLQGIIQVAAAFHHYLRNNRAGAESLLREGLKKIAGAPANYRGVRLDALRQRARWWSDELTAGRTPATHQLPRIESAS